MLPRKRTGCFPPSPAGQQLQNRVRFRERARGPLMTKMGAERKWVPLVFQMRVSTERVWNLGHI